MKKLLFILAALLTVGFAQAQVSITQNTLTYFQDFNTLDTVTSNTRTALPPGWTIAEHGTSANWKYRTGDGSVTTNDIYSFGTPQTTERAIGTIGGSTVDTLYYGMQFKNDIGADISLANITFKEEQWRSGDTGATYIDSVQVFYSFTADSLADNSTNANWTEIPSLLMTSIVLDKYSVAIKGDTAFRVVSSGINMVVPTGSKLWLRWRDWNSRGSDDALAVDSLTVKFGTLRAIVTDKYPANNTTHIALPTAPVKLVFDQPIQKSIGSIYIKNETDQLVQIISGSSGNVVVNDTVVLINGVYFLPNKTYHITFDSLAFLSLTGYSTFGIRDTSEWRFSTRVPTSIGVMNAANIRMAVLGTASSSRINLSYTLPEAGIMQLAITDMAGRLVYQTALQSAAGDNLVSLTPGTLQSGLYLVRLNGAGVAGYTKCRVE